MRRALFSIICVAFVISRAVDVAAQAAPDGDRRPAEPPEAAEPLEGAGTAESEVASPELVPGEPGELRVPREPEPPEPLPGFEPGPGAQPEPLPTPTWNPRWRKANFWDVFTVSVGSVFYVAESLIDTGSNQADWDRAILWDEDVREALRFKTSSGRDTAGLISDVMMIGSLVHNAIFDNLVVAWAIHGQPELALQMSLMNAEAYAIALSITSIVKASTSRARPMVSECDADPLYSPDCQRLDRFRSFFSGHSAVTAVGAGLLCAHHLNLPLYDGGIGDIGMCGLGIALTAATGAMRIASDNHWATDVTVGHVVGFASGFLVPTLLYYNERDLAPSKPKQDNGARRSSGYAIVTPMLSPDSLGLQAVGRM